MPVHTPERLREMESTGLEVFDDLGKHREMLDKAIKQADGIISRYEQGAVTDKDKQELPILLSNLEFLLNAELDHLGAIYKVDMDDGSYDNAGIDEKLRVLIRYVRNLNIELNGWYGTKTAKKILGWVHDVPKWFTIRWRQVKDYAKHVLFWAGLAGLGVAAGYGFYGWYTGKGVMGGLSLMWDHLWGAGKKVWNFFGGGGKKTP